MFPFSKGDDVRVRRKRRRRRRADARMRIPISVAQQLFLLAGTACVFLTSCGGSPSILDPHGNGATQMATFRGPSSSSHRSALDGRGAGVFVGVDGLATGVTYIDANGQEQEQPANVVMLTAYTLTNVRLMLLSRSGKHPNGIGNDRGFVGKNLMYQLFKTPVHPIFDGRRFNLFMGNGITRMLINDLNADNFDH